MTSLLVIRDLVGEILYTNQKSSILPSRNYPLKEVWGYNNMEIKVIKTVER